MWPLGSCIHPRLMASLNSIDDSNWAEVKHINCYAMFMGYLWMAMRGLGLLVVTWTTVVLLGGFVSMLDKKDFWSLTVIALVQTAGVFNTHPSENLAEIPSLCWNFLRTMNFTITWTGAQARANEESMGGCFSVGARKLAARGVSLIQAMVFFIIMCPVAALYGFGRFITTGVALWRLIEHDYGASGGGQTTNMNPALRVLYLLSVLQGTVFIYRGVLVFAGKKIGKKVAEGYNFEEGGHSPVLGYLAEVRIGCEKDPCFARGKNLITYAVNLMEAHSPDDLLSGTRILDTLITYDESPAAESQSPESQESRPAITYDESQMESQSHQPQESSSINVTTRHDEQTGTRIRIVTERLIGSSSSGKILQKLLKALDSRSPCDAEMRKRAARIVCALAGDIRLKQTLGAIRCISSLLDASLHQEVNEYKELMLQGLAIIKKLATHEENCRVMSDTHDLVSLIMRPLSCDLLHRFNHDEWSDVVDASLQVLCTWLNTVTGKSGDKLCSQIALNKEAISAMEKIITCKDGCQEYETLRIRAMKVLVTQIQDQTDTKQQIQDRECRILQLLGIFRDYTKDDYTAGLAGEKLLMLSRESKSNAKIILKANDGSIEAMVPLLHREGNIRICAAGILEGLCSHYTASDDCFEELKTLILSHVIPKVLTDIFLGRIDVHMHISSTELDLLDDETESIRIILKSNPEEIYAFPHDVLQTLPHYLRTKVNAKTVEWREKKKSLVAFLSLSVVVYDKVITPDQDLPPLFTKIASEDPGFNFPKRLVEMVKKNRFCNEVDCLRILKLVTKMAISMMMHKHIYDFSELEMLIESLKDSSKQMINLDAFVHLSGGDDGGTLGSLVQEAAKLLHTADEAHKPEDKKKGKEPETGFFEQGQSSSS